ncbi:MAG: TlpA family protein disulfide reductase, partial [Chloroflexia bacterium]
TPAPAGITHVPTPFPSPTLLPSDTPTPTPRPVGPGVGQEAPLFSLPTLDGREVSLEAFRGRPVLLHFWASWCPPCREEWPAWLAFATGPAAKDVVILAVNVEESPELVRHFLGQERPPFPVLLDADGQVNARYRVRALPMTFFIDAHGIVRRVVPGVMSTEALERLIGDQ